MGKMIRVGVNPVGWTNDLLTSLGDDISLDQCLQEASAAGFEGIELGRKFPRKAAELRSALRSSRLELISGWHSIFLLERTPDAELAAARSHIELLNEMGCAVLIAAECSGQVDSQIDTPLSNRPRIDDRRFGQFCDDLTRFAELVKREGLDLVYHHHMGTVIQSGEDIDKMMAGTGTSVKLLLDTGHAFWAGVDPVALARRHRFRIGHLHAKDVRAPVMRIAIREDWSFLNAVVQGVYTVPGDGAIDFKGLFAEFSGYSGWIVVEAEQDPEKADPGRYAQLGFVNVITAAAAAGLPLQCVEGIAKRHI